MVDNTEKFLRATQFNGKRDEDFKSCAMSTIVVLEGRYLADVVANEKKAHADKALEDHVSCASKVRKSRAVIVNALGDKHLREVQFCNMPSEMWAMLWERYAGKKVANQISVLTTLMNLKAIKDTTMGDHVARMESLIHRLTSMALAMAELIQVAVLLVSLENWLEYNGMVASIKTMDPGVAKWTNVTAKMINEQKKHSKSIVTPTYDTDKPILRHHATSGLRNEILSAGIATTKDTLLETV